MNDYIVSLIRTYVPIIVGAAIAWVSAHDGIGIDSAGLDVAVVGVATAVYYAIVRKLEAQWPKLGWLLGMPRKPVYVKP